MTAVIVPPALDAAAAEAKAYLRVEGAQENDLVARLTASSAGLCEAFTRQRLMAREGSELLTAAPGHWQRLNATPVRAILGLEALPADGAAFALGPDSFAVDIDHNQDGWVRVIDAFGAKRVRVRFDAGMAMSWEDLPEELRHGIVRLAAHLFTHRDRHDGAGPPAAVTALWRPWRRLRVG